MENQFEVNAVLTQELLSWDDRIKALYLASKAKAIQQESPVVLVHNVEAAEKLLIVNGEIEARVDDADAKSHPAFLDHLFERAYDIGKVNNTMPRYIEVAAKGPVCGSDSYLLSRLESEGYYERVDPELITPNITELDAINERLSAATMAMLENSQGFLGRVKALSTKLISDPGMKLVLSTTAAAALMHATNGAVDSNLISSAAYSTTMAAAASAGKVTLDALAGVSSKMQTYLYDNSPHYQSMKDRMFAGTIAGFCEKRASSQDVIRSATDLSNHEVTSVIDSIRSYQPTATVADVVAMCNRAIAVYNEQDNLNNQLSDARLQEGHPMQGHSR